MPTQTIYPQSTKSCLSIGRLSLDGVMQYRIPCPCTITIASTSALSTLLTPHWSLEVGGRRTQVISVIKAGLNYGCITSVSNRHS